MKVVAFLEPPQSDVIEDILKHCGLWQSSTARGPPDVDGIVLELDAAYSDSFPPCRFLVMACEAAACQAAKYGPIPQFVRNVPMPTRVSDDQKLDKNVSMST